MSTALVPNALNLPVGVNSIDAYVQVVNRIPVLSIDLERALAERLRDHNDLEAARQLVMAHLRFVVHIARGYLGYGLAFADLVQEGNVGLMKAVKRFDPEREVRLVSFAVHWIRAEIHEFILRNWRIVKVATTKAQRKLFFNLRSAKKRLGWLNREEAETIAEDLGVQADTLVEMESRLSGRDITFDPNPTSDDEGDQRSAAPAAYLQDATSPDPLSQLEREDWEERTNGQLAEALEQLNERSRDIVQRRWLSDAKPTLHELAAEYGISAERIRQIESNALKKLKSCMV
jgi:RNA polymerase sigma-32 factor